MVTFRRWRPPLSHILPTPSLLPSAKFSEYLLLHTMTTTIPTLNNTTRSPLFDHAPGSPSSRHQSSHSQQFPVSLNRHLSEPNIRSMAAHDLLHDPLSNATKGSHQQRRQGNGSVSPSSSSASDSAERRPSSAGPTASSSWESQVDILADSLQGKMTMTSTQGGCISLGSSSILVNELPFF